MSDPETNPNPALIGFDIVKHVTRAFYILPEDQPSFVRFQTAFTPDTTSFSERVRRRKETPGEKPAPMQIADIVNLQTGEEMRLVAHQVLKNTMDENYPSESYIGKDFRIIKTPKKGGIGGKYFAFAIVEIKLKGSVEAPPVEERGELEFDRDLEYPDQETGADPNDEEEIEGVNNRGENDPLPGLGTRADLDVPVINLQTIPTTPGSPTAAAASSTSSTPTPPAWMAGTKPRPNGQDVRHAGPARKPQTAKSGRTSPRSK